MGVSLDFVSAVFNLITSGKSGGEVLPLFMAMVIVFLLKDRLDLIKKIEKKEEKLEKIVDDFYKGNLTMTEALNSLKLVLFEIKGKL